MKQAISFVTLGVGDLARSRAFYRALGWRESSGSQAEVAFYQAGSVAFALFARASLAEDANVPPHGSGFPGFTLAHNVPSETAVDATLREAVAGGGPPRARGRARALGRLPRLLRRSRRLPLGGLLQSLLSARRERVRAAAGIGGAAGESQSPGDGDACRYMAIDQKRTGWPARLARLVSLRMNNNE